VRAIMSEMGKAMMGTGEASGEKRAIEAAEAAISNPLLDDVSMRGARGLLISISGGPDLTLYEVDEAATRIREEVDPEANIILGATFDDSLEGTMRVSVVATGLALDLPAAATEPEEAPQQNAPRPVFGYTGKQPIPVKKPIQPAPMAARPAVKPAPTPAPAPAPIAQAEEEMQDESDMEEHMPAGMPEPQPQVAQAMLAPRPQARMPQIEDFPPIAQRQMAAQQNRIEHIAEHAKKRKGLFERLASVGLGRKDDPPPAQREPVMQMRSEPKMQPQTAPQPRQAPQPASHIDPHLDDDQLEIPAFLRRQAN